MTVKSVFKSEESRDLIQTKCRALYESWPVPNEKRMVETSRGITHVVISGESSAPPLLLLHGTSSNSAGLFQNTISR